jgi:hypothetical protein
VVHPLPVCAKGGIRKSESHASHPVKRGLLLEPEQWQWSSYCSYAYEEEGRANIHQWPKALMKLRAAA